MTMDIDMDFPRKIGQKIIKHLLLVIQVSVFFFWWYDKLFKVFLEEEKYLVLFHLAPNSGGIVSLNVHSFFCSVQPLEDPGKTTSIIIEALKDTGQRGILDRGWGDLGVCKYWFYVLFSNCSDPVNHDPHYCYI